MSTGQDVEYVGYELALPLTVLLVLVIGMIGMLYAGASYGWLLLVSAFACGLALSGST